MFNMHQKVDWQQPDQSRHMPETQKWRRNKSKWRQLV